MRDVETGQFAPIHGMRETPLYRVFNGMVDRCCNSQCKKWKDYGGRGITICKEWLDDRSRFFEWALANGYRGDLQIDRIDNNGPYSPENCRFTTPTVQCRNRRSTKLTESQVADIKHLLSQGYSLTVIGEKYGVVFQYVHGIKKGHAWRDVKPSSSVDQYPERKQMIRRRRSRNGR